MDRMMSMYQVQRIRDKMWDKMIFSINRLVAYRQFQPFSNSTRQRCPFSWFGVCDISTPFPNRKAISKHVREKHWKIVDSKDIGHMLESGNTDICCPRQGCTKVFARYDLAVQHARARKCQGDSPTDIRCPWQAFTGCLAVSETTKSYSNHVQSHVDDPRAPFMCSVGCGQYYACLYTLAQHELRCKGIPRPISAAMYQYGLAEDSGLASTTIIVARSSNTKPKSWGINTSTEAALKLFGSTALSSYKTVFPHSTASEDTSVILARAELPSKYTPFVDEEVPRSLPDKDVQQLQRSRRFTQLLQKHLQASASRPTIISVGLNGWTCCIHKMLQFLQLPTTPPFTFVLAVKESQLRYGIPTSYARHSGKY
ncbi:hypothetical protein DM02DRAFT_659792 [Periconia macrospinosa]|uniref:Uncharacterized protein n=1 Tax=Periconia macrospinosa TaxID=97972 RepID=A0A2V1DCE0_9PLEO|nr:hypothetical protein DM02DRAFT_659792 [Periconia macrospinosa]